MIISQKPDFNLAQPNLFSLHSYLYIPKHFHITIDTETLTRLPDYF